SSSGSGVHLRQFCRGGFPLPSGARRSPCGRPRDAFPSFDAHTPRQQRSLDVPPDSDHRLPRKCQPVLCQPCLCPYAVLPLAHVANALPLADAASRPRLMLQELPPPRLVRKTPHGREASSWRARLATYVPETLERLSTLPSLGHRFWQAEECQ